MINEKKAYVFGNVIMKTGLQFLQFSFNLIFKKTESKKTPSSNISVLIFSGCRDAQLTLYTTETSERSCMT